MLCKPFPNKEITDCDCCQLRVIYASLQELGRAITYCRLPEKLSIAIDKETIRNSLDKK